MRVTLKTMTSEDLPQVAQWRNHPEVRAGSFNTQEITLDGTQAWFAQAKGTHLIGYDESNEPVGVVNFSEVKDGTATWGIYTVDPTRKGLGRPLGQAALRYAFEELKLRRVLAETLSYNPRSGGFHRSLGFELEGRRLDQLSRGKDVLLWAAHPHSLYERNFRMGERWVGPDHAPLIVAEMSGNHNGSLERALEIVDAAAKAGAHALKIQTYTADTMTLNLNQGEFTITDPGSLWNGESLYQLYEKAHTPWDWHKPIFDRCKEHGMLGFSAPFDETAVDFLESLDVPAYKIASFENVDLPLIKKVAATGKPLIISTGMATQEEIGEAVAAARSAGCEHLILLRCTSTYPADPKDSDLQTVRDLSQRFGVLSGLSDHTLGIGAALASVGLGACVVEKHFTLSRADGGVDSAFSLEPSELTALVEESERAWKSMGSVRYGPTTKEQKSLQFRRSLYIAEDLKQGDVLSAKNLRRIRPGFGLAPKHYEGLLGRKVVQDVSRGTPMTWELVGGR